MYIASCWFFFCFKRLYNEASKITNRCPPCPGERIKWIKDCHYKTFNLRAPVNASNYPYYHFFFQCVLSDIFKIIILDVLKMTLLLIYRVILRTCTGVWKLKIKNVFFFFIKDACMHNVRPHFFLFPWSEQWVYFFKFFKTNVNLLLIYLRLKFGYLSFYFRLFREKLMFTNVFHQNLRKSHLIGGA